MAKKFIVEGFKVKADAATLDLKELYKRMWRWFEAMGYSAKETEYREMSDASGSQSLEIRWECSRDEDSYAKHVIQIDFFLLGIKEVEVEKNGVQTKLMKGTFEIQIFAFMDRARGYDSSFLGYVKKWFEDYLLKDRLDRQEKNFRGEVEALVAEIKVFFWLYGAVV